MTQENKELLLKDLCARLPYGIMFKYKERAGDYPNYHVHHVTTITINGAVTGIRGGRGDVFHIEDLKPYLRPMSSMTEEEVDEIRLLLNNSNCGRVINDENFRIEDFGVLWFTNMRASECVGHTMMCIVIDWLNAHHFDYRGLIEKGLAIEAPEGMYKKGE